MKRAVWMAGATVVAISLTAGIASAKGGFGKSGPRVTFEELDLNGDGQLSPEEMAAQATARFNAVDTNGDGTLSADELAARSERLKEERIARMIERRDQNGDGVLSLSEMQPSQDRAERMFDRLDSDGNGTISAEEFADLQGKRKGKRGGHDKPDGDRDAG